MTQTLPQVLLPHSNKKYIIRHKGMPSRHDIDQYPNSDREWYYCKSQSGSLLGTWRHLSFIKYPLISELGGPVTEKFDKLRVNIYRDNQIELVECTDEMLQEFTISKLKGAL